MTRSRTLSHSPPGPVLWPAAGAAAGRLPVFSLVSTALSRVPAAGPLCPLGELTTAVPLVPVLWCPPVAVVIPRSGP
ncbi:hypothetical protein [Kocuria nitroreducens]|uniref:hypothetical protein n=1 Tax=Kocuria nitroreducens TaxID=3058914 RepID=UPI0036DE7D08